MTRSSSRSPDGGRHRHRRRRGAPRPLAAERERIVAGHRARVRDGDGDGRVDGRGGDSQRAGRGGPHGEAEPRVALAALGPVRVLGHGAAQLCRLALQLPAAAAVAAVGAGRVVRVVPQRMHRCSRRAPVCYGRLLISCRCL